MLAFISLIVTVALILYLGQVNDFLAALVGSFGFLCTFFTWASSVRIKSRHTHEMGGKFARKS